MSARAFVRWSALGVLLVVAGSASAVAQDSDEAALALADRAEVAPSAPHACVGSVEAAAAETTWRGGGAPAGAGGSVESAPGLGGGASVVGAAAEEPAAPTDGGRASLDLRCEKRLSDRLRGTFADRIDDLWSRGSAAQTVETLKEAYLTWQQTPDQLFDVGRINVREGVGLAYNPTDYFRADALRTLISLDPTVLRSERLGSVMARSQTLWSSGSLTAIFSPRLASQPSAAPLSADFGASNAHDRWLVILSERMTESFEPQWLLTQAAHGSPQAGLNLTWLLSRAAVAYLEASAGRSRSELALSQVEPSASGETAFRSRLSAGLTDTTAWKLTLSLEYEYDGAAAGDREWAALRAVPALFAGYRGFVAAQQELATRQNVFAYAQWDDVGLAHLDVTGLVRVDPYDHSRLAWGEIRYHWERIGAAIQWQRGDGEAASDLSLWPVRQTWLAVIDYDF